MGKRKKMDVRWGEGERGRDRERVTEAGEQMKGNIERVGERERREKRERKGEGKRQRYTPVGSSVTGTAVRSLMT